MSVQPSCCKHDPAAAFARLDEEGGSSEMLLMKIGYAVLNMVNLVRMCSVLRD